MMKMIVGRLKKPLFFQAPRRVAGGGDSPWQAAHDGASRGFHTTGT